MQPRPNYALKLTGAAAPVRALMVVGGGARSLTLFR